ncbi:MAG: hypothetical protein IKN72_02765 [Clostridia bacterium]|nr:hypothetical protein [Clostridia bacterium]
MKKKVILSCAILLAAAIIFCFTYAPLRLRLYPGNRISGTVQISIDGKDFTLSEKNVWNMDKLKIRFTDNEGAEVYGRAGEYGDYAFELRIDELDRPITVHCFQHIWWNILRFELGTSKNR